MVVLIERLRCHLSPSEVAIDLGVFSSSLAVFQSYLL